MVRVHPGSFFARRKIERQRSTLYFLLSLLPGVDWVVFPTAACKAVVGKQAGADDERFNSFTTHFAAVRISLCAGGAGARLALIRRGARLDTGACNLWLSTQTLVKRPGREPGDFVGSTPTSATVRIVPSSSGEDACLTHRIAQVRVLPGRLSQPVRRCYGRHASPVRRWSGFDSRADLVGE